MVQMCPFEYTAPVKSCSSPKGTIFAKLLLRFDNFGQKKFQQTIDPSPRVWLTGNLANYDDESAIFVQTNKPDRRVY